MIETKTPILFFDTETTWILKDEKWNIISNWSLIQLAYRKIDDSWKQDINLFFNTDTKIEIWSMAVHGIYKGLLLDKSNWKYLWDEDREKLSKVFNENIIIAHNLDFDKDVLDKSFISVWDKSIDTLKVARILLSEWVLSNWDNVEAEFLNLQYLRYFFKHYEIKDEKWNLECTTAHDALWDVIVLEQVFYSLFEIIKNKLNITDEQVLEKMMEMTKKEFVLIKTMRIGKYRWKSFEEVYNIDKWYLQWMIWADFTEDIKYTCKVWLWLIEDKKFFS